MLSFARSQSLPWELDSNVNSLLANLLANKLISHLDLLILPSFLRCNHVLIKIIIVIIIIIYSDPSASVQHVVEGRTTAQCGVVGQGVFLLPREVWGIRGYSYYLVRCAGCEGKLPLNFIYCLWRHRPKLRSTEIGSFPLGHSATLLKQCCKNFEVYYNNLHIWQKSVIFRRIFEILKFWNFTCPSLTYCIHYRRWHV